MEDKSVKPKVEPEGRPKAKAVDPPAANPKKPRTFSGNLHWYTTPEIHQRLARNAEMKGFTIRDYIEQALLMQMEMDQNLFETD